MFLAGTSLARAADMIRNHLRLAALASCSLPLVLGCASRADEPIGEASAAVDWFTYLRIDGIQGETQDTSREGTLLTWEQSSDGFGTAQVVTDCEGPICRVVSVDTSLVSSKSTFDGPTSVWEFSAIGNNGQLWTDHTVTREPPQGTPEESIAFVYGKLQIEYISQDGTKPKNGWSTMGPAGSVSCAYPDCGADDLEDGWICFPTCLPSLVK